MTEILYSLNTEQKKAVTTTEGPLLIIAGSGTGKTTVITRRIAYLIKKKLAKPSEILALTFTEKAAAEMEERVDVLVPYGYVDTWISTFHAFGDRVLREKALEMGMPSDFKVLSKPQQILFVLQNLFSFKLRYYRPLSNPTKFIEAILSFISRAKDEDNSPEELQKYLQKSKNNLAKIKNKEEKSEKTRELEKIKELADFYTHYEELKEAAGKIDYGDQVFKTLQLFRKNPEILKNYQKKFKYILVDEYQDTNYSQNELVKLLASSHKNLTVVGDDDQSIYKFRGASISNILQFKKDFPKAEQIVLTVNYRSTQELLDSSYRLIKFNDPDRLEVKNKINKKLISVIKKKGERPQDFAFEALSEESDFVAEKIEKIIKNKKNYKEIAILVRANSQADPFIRGLNLRKIPFKFSGISGLYGQKEIRLLISFLKTLVSLEDSLSLYDLAVSEIYQLPVADTITLSDFSKKRNRSLAYTFANLKKLEEIEVSDKAAAIVEKLISDQSEALELSRKENIGKVLYRFLEKTLYLKKLEKEGSVESVLKIQNIAKFFDKITEFIQISQNESVAAFVDYLETMQQVGDDPAAADFDPDLDAVSLLTVHAAKGLEFSTVFMVGLVADRFPSRERSEILSLPEELIKETLPEGDFHIQEERRLFYVGSTRAKERLYYTWSRDAGGKRLKKISPFVLEALDKPSSEGKVQAKSSLEKIKQFEIITQEKVLLSSVAKRRIITLSQGSIDDYETCAYKYRYAHVLRLPILRHHAVVYGFALHASVAEFWKIKLAGITPKLDQLYEVLENTWVNEGFLTAAHEEQRLVQAKSVLKAFWQRENSSKELPSFIEKPFRFSLDTKEVQVVVNGRYDRVDIEKDKVRIIDYKSTENRTEEELAKNAKDSIQLKVYTLAYFKNYRVVPDFVGIYDLESGLVGGYSPDKELIKKTEEEVIEVAGKVQENLMTDSFPANPKYFGRTPACYYCPFNSICPFSLVRK
ncbi:MAG TPA: ATP-dependent DNA helicase [Candidatus Saccharimonadales bacterium]|nr:ATP-dependent DNA helicase [Candidatus Saccharimonadales bacterium]